MVAAMAIAFVAANTSLKPYYDLVHHMPVHVRIGGLRIDRPMIEWVNEGLIVVFFLLVGLEIKRQLLEGHLADRKVAVLPAIAAFGGMVVPAGLYLAVTWQHPEFWTGWAVPTATDIVLVLGLLALMGDRIPVQIKILFTALATFDDIGAVAILAIFFNEAPPALPLLVGIGAVAGLAVINGRRMTRPWPYIALGLVLWVAMLEAGLEAALAGVIVGLFVPLRGPTAESGSPLRTTERRLHPMGVLIVVPLFAFFNSGIAVPEIDARVMLSPAPIGVVAGLLIGKPVGLLVSSWLAVRTGVAALPAGIGWRHMLGVAQIAGIGFTMSLFIAQIAFADAATVVAVKLAVLVGSAASVLVGLWMMAVFMPRQGDRC